MSKKILSMLLAVVMVLSSLAIIAVPAAAATDLVNLYNDVTDGYTARAELDYNQYYGSINRPYLAGDVTYVTTEPIDVKAGDVLYFGPANAGQGLSALLLSHQRLQCEG